MSEYGVSGADLPDNFPYKDAIDQACVLFEFSPVLAGAVAWRETLEIAAWIGTAYPGKTPLTVVTGDGGHGLFQLTSEVPLNWENPFVNAQVAVRDYLAKDLEHWHAKYGLEGEDLVRATAASFNAGWDQAEKWHLQGDVDLYTTHRYGVGVLVNYRALVAGH